MEDQITETMWFVGVHSKESGRCTELAVNQRFSNMHVLTTKFEVACWKGALPCKLDLTKANPIQWEKRSDGSILSPKTMTLEEYVQYLPLLFEGWVLQVLCVSTVV